MSSKFTIATHFTDINEALHFLMPLEVNTTEATTLVASHDQMIKNEGAQQVLGISSSFHAFNSPHGRRQRTRSSESEEESRLSPPSLSNGLPSIDVAEFQLRRLQNVSVNSAEHTNGAHHSDTTTEYSSRHRRAAVSVLSAHSSCSSKTVGRINYNIDNSEINGRPESDDTALPCRYYVDGNGQMRIKKFWWCYTRIRRILWFVFPCLKRDSNTFLSAKMLANTMLIVAVYFIRGLLNHAVIPSILTHRDERAQDEAETQCYKHSLKFLDMYAYSLLASIVLCLPALNFNACRLYQPVSRSSVEDTTTLSPRSSMDSPSSAVVDVHMEQQRFEKTYLFTLCELVVIVDIPYLVVTLVIIFKPSRSGSIIEMLDACNRQLTTGFFVLLVMVELVAVYAYILRWRQILLFHRLHQHFFFQRGYVSGHSRFDYVEKSFATPLYAWLPAPLWACWQRCKQDSTRENQDNIAQGSTKQRIHAIKVALYSAAKRGDVEKVRTLLESAVRLSGSDFASEWYEPRVLNFCSIFLLACGQRNPLHVAIAFDQIEVVRELLANGHFDVQQLDKLELLRLDCGWLYRVMFRVLFFILRRSSASIVANASLGAGVGNGGAAPGLTSASHPFGPVGLFQATLLTPLHVAVTLGHVDLTLLLLRYGAKPNASAVSTHPRFATPPLYWAVNKECTRLLLDAGGNPLALPGDANGLLLTAFEVARIAGNAAVARQMEKYGGDVALTPLHDACAGGRCEEVAFLLEHGADPDTLGEQVCGCFQRTPLHWAAMRGHASIIKLLIRYGANVNARDVFGRTPLAWACVLNRTRAVEMLLSNNADVNVRDAQGDPLLCICAAGACASMKRGAKTVAGKRENIGEDRLQEDDCDGGDNYSDVGVTLSGSKALSRGFDPRIFQLLLDHGVRLHDSRTVNGDSALHVALRRQNRTAAVLFVRAGLSLTAMNFLGQRAIDCAQSPDLRFAVKKEAGHRDVMISYSHAHASLACQIRDALECHRVTTWIDTMGPTGITGGAVWRQEIARGIQSSALVLAVLTKDYPQSQWCMKELAFAKMQNIPVVAIQCEDMEISEELQVYLWTRQVIDFRPAVKQLYAIKYNENQSYPPSDEQIGESAKKKECVTMRNSSHTVEDSESHGVYSDEINSINEADGIRLEPDSNDNVFSHCLRMLLDGIQDQIEEHRARLARRQAQQQQVQLPRHEMDDRAGENASHCESFCDDSECSRVEDKRLCETSSVCGNLGECEDAETINFPEDILTVPLSRPFRRIESLVALTTADSFVFIAHGDYHRSFCLRLRKSLLKQGVRCVVDQSALSVRYAHQSQEYAATDLTSEDIGSDVNERDQRLSVQTRQLAAKDAIIACSAVLVILSRLTVNCDLLADQLAFAEDRGKLLVPILLSMDKVDLAKRYTFSRSMVHHFNISLGYEQSVEQLTKHLKIQQSNKARQQRHQRREHSDQNLFSRMTVLSPVSASSPAQRSSSLDSYTEVMELPSPYEDNMLSTDASLLLPPLPVTTIMTSFQGERTPKGSSGGHGLSDSDIARRDKSRSGSSNVSTRSRESSLRLTGSSQHRHSTRSISEDIV
ncbi:Ankyrin [Plasmopara halstedii]|uniref:Ankyrin n=1 Tax=Plasmopara halstedii TaxID=4781 RepID=A0A0P1AZ90_PLAHL|nr:Ankyrin [Plasmopara halstedii]CEG46999.1 Ankyrin [Plasmopara halstedii]|eukprot:XP_024583368.1 Ankyrin [Plasmopara halstedii]